jgi:hypothetical protein
MGNKRGEKALGECSIVIKDCQAVAQPFQISTKTTKKKKIEVTISAKALPLVPK